MGNGSQFSGDITASNDITTSARIEIQNFVGEGDGTNEPTLLVGRNIDAGSEIRINNCIGDITAVESILGKLFLGELSPSVLAMDGNLSAANLDPDMCVYLSVAANSSIFWGPDGRINGEFADRVPADRGHDACFLDPNQIPVGCIVGVDSDCDGVLNNGSQSPDGSQDDEPCNTTDENPSGCDDNCLNATNNGFGIVAPLHSCYSVQTDIDDDGIGDACDNCLDAYNKSQLDCDNDRTGDACDANKGFYDTLADRDNDGDVDGVDFSVFAACFNKSGNPPRTTGCSSDDADAFDVDCDGDVDGVDFSVFASCFNKTGNSPRRLGCPAARRSRS